MTARRSSQAKKDETMRSTRRELIGTVVNHSGVKTLKIRVESKFPHGKYGKIVKNHRTYLANYVGNSEEVKVGDEVKIRECAPISKMKRWEFIEVTKKTDLITSI